MFFEVQAKCGHVGRNNYIVKKFYVKAESAKEAAKVIRSAPRVKHHQKEMLGTVKLDYQNKTYNDITRIRAIVMTDDCICWIDNADYKKNNAAITLQSSENQRKKSEEFLKTENICQNLELVA